ncbi:hypothetical protein [Paenibacillus dendritiformis]|nr:hypothetical protein [Paenibacillus dendritiformis]CAH8768885.1 hypothetical protein H7S4_001583 [Paenibacillus dendritiformis]
MKDAARVVFSPWRIIISINLMVQKVQKVRLSAPKRLQTGLFEQPKA